MAFLNKLQVPATGSGDNQTLLMPKLQFRFRLTFFNFGNGEVEQLTRQVIDCSRPNLSFAKITVPVYNSTIYLAGKHTWNTMTINLRDDANNQISKTVGNQIQKQLNMQEQASARAAQDYKFRLVLDMLDGGNGDTEVGILESWDLQGCYVESVNYNTVNYGTSEVVTISLTVQYDNAVQVEPSSAGLNDPATIYGEIARTSSESGGGGLSTSEGVGA
jgi:hypothetical protein